LAQTLAQDRAVRLDDTPDAEPAVDATLYDALYAALSAHARGRAFLDEIARRARRNDTSAALAALARIEAKLNASLEARAEANTEPDRSTSPPPVREEPAADRSLADSHVPCEAGDREGADPPPAVEARDHALAGPPAEPASPALDQSPHADLIAQVMALSPEERIALFS
jgi:hypothetical protein